MCKFASFKHNPNQPSGYDIRVADLFSHGNTEKILGLTEKQGWYDGHYLPSGTVEFRIPGGTSEVAVESVKERWPTFMDFLRWAYQNGADVNAKDNDGQTALYWASCSGRAEVVTLLLDAKADVNTKDNNGQTALYWASYYGHAEVVKLLKQHGAQ